VEQEAEIGLSLGWVFFMGFQQLFDGGLLINADNKIKRMKDVCFACIAASEMLWAGLQVYC